MAKIEREYDVGLSGVPCKLKVLINDEIAIMISPYGKETYKMYLKAKEAGKLVQWDYRRQWFIEKYLGLKAEEIVILLDKDFLSAKFRQQQAQEGSKEALK